MINMNFFLKIKKLWPIYILQLLFLSAIFVINPVSGQDNEGDYVNYTLNYSMSNSYYDRVGSGNVGIEIVEIYENATARIKTFGSVNDIEFSITKTSNRIQSIFPYLISIPAFDQLLRVGNLTVEIKTNGAIDEQIDFKGNQVTLNVSRIYAKTLIEHEGETYIINLNGEIKLFSKSGLLYYLDLEFNEESDENKIMEIIIKLLDSNLDPNIKLEFKENIFSRLDDFSSFAIPSSIFTNDFQSIINNSNNISDDTASNSIYFYLISGSLGAAIVTIIFLSFKRYNGGKSEENSEDKPLHWVN